MPIIGGILKDGTKVKTEDFFNGICPEPGFPLTFIKEALKTREWDGNPHVTSLLTGTREQYLKNVSKYYVSLDGMVLAMAGNRFHANMEDDMLLTEIGISLNGIQGTMDLLEVYPWDETLGVTDYKLVGSYRLIKWFGISKRPIPVTDDFGNPVFIKTGKNKGQPKTKTEHYVSDEAKERFDYTMQTNIYRVAIERMLADPDWQKSNPEQSAIFNKKIMRLRIFFAIRDSGINHDFSFNSFYEDCERINNREVLNFIADRSKKIIDAMANWNSDIESGETRIDAAAKNCPPMCSAKETWNGKKCEKYCDVREACIKMREMSL